MPDGVRSTNLPTSSLVDEVIGHRDIGGVRQTVRVTTDALALKVAQAGALGSALARADAAAAAAEAYADLAASGAVTFSAATWAQLAAIAPTMIGQRAAVSTADTGTHTGRTAASPAADAADVPNAGVYGAYDIAAGAWRRDGDDVTVAMAGNSAALRALEESGNAEARFLSRAANRAAAWPRSLIVILLGQSLNAPREGGAPVVSGAPAGSRMMAGGASVTAFGYNATSAEWCTNWSDVATDAPFAEGAGQTPLTLQLHF